MNVLKVKNKQKTAKIQIVLEKVIAKNANKIFIYSKSKMNVKLMNLKITVQKQKQMKNVNYVKRDIIQIQKKESVQLLHKWKTVYNYIMITNVKNVKKDIIKQKTINADCRCFLLLNTAQNIMQLV